jgi:hypothetical protein
MKVDARKVPEKSIWSDAVWSTYGFAPPKIIQRCHQALPKTHKSLRGCLKNIQLKNIQ